MGYCTVNDMITLLPKTITIGNNTLVNSDVIQKQGKADSVSIQDAQQFIEYASQYIDASLTAVYLCPLKRVKFFEVPIQADAHSRSTTINVGPDAARFTPGQLVRIADDNNTEISAVGTFDDTVPANYNTVTLNAQLLNTYTVANNAMLSVLQFPNPIPMICARYAVSLIIDKQYVANQSPDVSNYGKSMRNSAAEQMDKILTGVIRLDAQEYTGRRFANQALFDSWKSPSEIQPGASKE